MSAEQEVRPGVAIYVRVSSTGQLGRDGDEDGYSIPAQVKACERVAADRGFDVVKVFAERAESARSDNRPVLQEMMKELPGLGVEALIVHKVDRLARNRLDDAQLYQRLVGMGVRLISATENIDATPAGQLMHGMLASFAEYYSNNLAAEVKKGLRQKHASGGTPFRPPVGYKPHRVMIGKQDIRTVVLDDERAPLVRMAFALYATGDWTLIKLTAHLAQLGLTSRPTVKLAAKPLAVSTVHAMLSNDYYAGIVTYRGKRAVGRHERLVDDETFSKVQMFLMANRHGERASKHEHYLRSTVFCECCGGRLLFGRHRSRNGSHYEYFSCVNRASRQRSDVACASPHFRVDVVEEKVEDLWSSVRLKPDTIAAVRRDVAQHIAERAEVADREVKRHEKRIREVEEKQRKLLDLFYRDLISEAVFEKEQAQLREDRSAIVALQEATEAAREQVDGQLETAIALLADPGSMYRRANPIQRRALNRWFWQRIDVGEDGDVIDAEVTPLPDAFRPWQPGLGKVRPLDGVRRFPVRPASGSVHLVGRRPRPGGAFAVHPSTPLATGAPPADKCVMRPVRSTLMIVVAAALAVGGCGAGGDGASSGSPSAVGAARPGRSATALMEGAARDLAKVKSYHVTGQLEEAGEITSVTGDLLPNGFGRVKLAVGETRVELVLLREGVYLKANAEFWRENVDVDVPDEVMRLLAGRWVAQDAPDGAMKGVLESLGPQRLAACLRGGIGTVTRAGTETLDGEPVLVVDDAGDAPGTAPSRYYLRREAPHLLVRAVQTGPDHPGELPDRACAGDHEDSGSSSDSGELRFSRFDALESIHPPHGAATVQEILRAAGFGGAGGAA
jgi:DNA invertase Pin-like site-specific DNA recombinase